MNTKEMRSLKKAVLSLRRCSHNLPLAEKKISFSFLNEDKDNTIKKM